MRIVTGDAIPIVEDDLSLRYALCRNYDATDPCYPSALPLTERDLPCRLQRLEEFIWLKKSAHRKRIEQAKRDEEDEKIGGGWGGL